MRSLRSPLLAVLLLFGVLLLVGVPLLSRGNLVTQPDTDDGPPIEYRSEPLGFRLTHPQKWQVLEDPKELVQPGTTGVHRVAFVPNPDSKTLIFINIQTLTTTQTLEQYADQQLIDLRSNEARIEFSDLKPMTLGGLDARVTDATVDGGNPSGKRELIIAIKEQRAYTLVYFGPAEGRYAQAFQSMADTFAFLP